MEGVGRAMVRRWSVAAMALERGDGWHRVEFLEEEEVGQ